MKATAITLNYSTREINMDFRIKVYGTDEQGNRINTLMGVSGIIDLIGVELLNKFFAVDYIHSLGQVVGALTKILAGDVVNALAGDFVSSDVFYTCLTL